MANTRQKPNEALRYHRLLRGWSQHKVADEIGASNEMISRWEGGQKKTSSFYQEKLCALFGMNAEELGFLLPADDDSSHNEQQVFFASGRELFPVVQLEKYNLSSRIYPIEASNTSINNLAIITEQFRAMQRRGDVLIADGINTHIKTIQETLECTLDDNRRCELWRVLAQTQIVAAFNPMKKTEQGRVKTFLETAVASAQNSNDMVLIGAALGHLAQFALREEQNLTKALQLIRRAREHIQTSHPLNGWFLLLMASLAAKAGHEQQCEAHLTDAMTIAHHLPKTPEYTDIYFTDFGLVSAQTFMVNNWLTLGNAEKAYAHLTRINLEDLSDNRRASAFCDAAKACAMMEEFPMAQDFAFQAIDKALATRQDYVIARCRELAQMLQKKERGKSYASALATYIHFVAQESEGTRK
jgi:transcriptional regulator with XRE-family HTH domain